MKLHSCSAGSRPLNLAALAVLFLAGLFPLLSGCVAVAAGAAGAGAVAYVRGELSSDLPYDIDAVHKASLQALDKMNFIKISDQKTAVDAEIVSRTALDKKVEIKLERGTDKATKVRIRVGLVGDQPISLSVLDQINTELK